MNEASARKASPVWSSVSLDNEKVPFHSRLWGASKAIAYYFRFQVLDVRACRAERILSGFQLVREYDQCRLHFRWRSWEAVDALVHNRIVIRVIDTLPC